jgi:hypothetical protein
MRTSLADRVFGLWLAVLLSIAALLAHRHGHTLRERIFAAGALLLFTTALLRPGLLHPLNALLSRAAGPIGRVVQAVLMTILFYCVFTPFGLFLRLLRKDLLRLSRSNLVDSYWQPRIPPGPPPESMLNQF